ncbi:MAG TPA: metallophosphoesterase, partial [Mycobacteriales bacterium]|nr:metallophosphoesterase [Mycobacteriales bacterium]
MTDADSGRGRSRVRGAGVLAGLLAGAALAGCQGGPPPRQATPSAPTPSAPTPSAPAARTAPAPGAQPGAGQGRVVTGFLAFGDFGNRSGQSSVARAMRRWAATHRIDALVTTGDNVYPNGEPEHYGDALDAPYAVLRRTAPLWVTLGNHDERRGHGDTQLRHLGLPSLPYTKSLPQVQLLFLDGNRVTRAQGRWLDRELSAPGPRHRVVVFHQPAYSCSRHGSTDDVVDRWVPILERHRVSLVLSGHDHNYQRFVS